MASSTPMSGIAPSVRLLLAMFRLYADINTGLGQGLLDLLKRSYPDEKIDLNPQAIGAKLMNIAKKQVQQDETRAQDVIQDFLTYLVSKNWDFKKDFPKWQDALDAIYTNVRRRAISESMGKTRQKKREKGVDEAYGQRPEGGGAPEGGEARMPTDPESLLGKALDDKAAVKELFDLIFEDNIGSFGSDIKENMGQASALKDKYPDLYKKHEKRWSGFVGDLRKKLLDEIWKYLDEYMEPAAYDQLKETFFGDVDPSAVRRMEKKKVQDKLDYQRGIDERKVSRFKWKEQQGTLTPAEKKSYDSLKKKLVKEGVDVNAIPAEENPGKGKGGEGEGEGESQVASGRLSLHRSLSIAARVASKPIKPHWS